MIDELDWRAAGTGALLALAILEPPVQIVRALDKGDDSYWWVVGAVALLVAFAVGGWWAARRQPARPFLHGAVAAAMAFVVVAIIGAFTSDEGLNIASTILVGQIAVSLGVLGAWVSTRRRPSGSTA